MFGLSKGEILLVAMIFILIFGWGWIPKIGQRLGSLFDGVKKGLREDDPRISVRPPTGTNEKR